MFFQSMSKILCSFFFFFKVEQDFAYGVVVSYVEIFNDYVFDLLEDVKQGNDVNPK